MPDRGVGRGRGVVEGDGVTTPTTKPPVPRTPEEQQRFEEWNTRISQELVDNLNRNVLRRVQEAREELKNDDMTPTYRASILRWLGDLAPSVPGSLRVIVDRLQDLER